MIKKYIILLLVLVAFNTSYSQKYIKSKFIDAEYYFLFDEYSKALPIYLGILDKDPSNANINYRIALCYMNMVGQKYKAIPYLEKAVQDVTENYNEGSYKELHAPFEAYLYLGDAYRINEELDKAIDAYKTFKSLLNPREIYFLDIVERQIKSCEYAKELFFEPVMVDEIPMSDVINTPLYEYNPVMNSKEDMLIFHQSKAKELIFLTKLENGVWTKPKNINNTVKSDGFFKVVCISPDGKNIILTDESMDNDGDLYISQMKKSKPYPMEKMSRKINSKYSETHACFSPDGKTLYFTSDRKGGYGGLDIYKSEKNSKGEWEDPVNLGSTINSKYSEDTPFMLEDGKTLYFSSEGHNSLGGFDYFVTTQLNDTSWSVPMNLGYPINTTDDDLFYNPSRNGDYAYCARIKNFGDSQSDIYKIIPNQTAIPKDFVLSGNVILNDGRIDKMNLVSINIFDTKNNKEIVTLKPDSLGHFEGVIPVTDCKITAQASGYNKSIESIVIPKVVTKIEFQYDIELFPSLIASNNANINKIDTASIVANNDTTLLIAENTTKNVVENNQENTSTNNNSTDNNNITADNTVGNSDNNTNNVVENNQEDTNTNNGNSNNISNNNITTNNVENVVYSDTTNNVIENNQENSNANNTVIDNSSNVTNENNTENNNNTSNNTTTNNVIAENTNSSNSTTKVNTNIENTTSNNTTNNNEDIYVAKSVFFDFASYNLNSESKTEVERLYKTLKANPNLKVEISGHTDSKGNPEFNKKLSERRANSVLSYLKSRGISSTRITIKAYGEEQNIAINVNPDGTDNPDGRQLNRRVDINLLGTPNQNIVVENITIPDNLKYSDDTKFYVLLGEISEKYEPNYFNKFNISELKNSKTYSTSKGYAYVAGEFTKKPDALKLLNNSIDAGFEDAKIINSFELNSLIAESKTTNKNIASSFETKNENSYTVQISAIRTKADQNKFTGITQLQEVYCNDGYYRYVVGEYSDYIEARSKRNELAQMGYPDAFVIKTALIASKISGTKAETTSNTNSTNSSTSPVNTPTNSNSTYTIQIKAMNTPIGTDNFKNIENVVERICDNGFVKYTVGEYPNIEVASYDLDKIKQAGYHDAFIVNLNSFNEVKKTQVNSNENNKASSSDKKYTIQIKASKEQIKIKDFKKYKNQITEYIGNDGYYRYAIGSYSSYSEAKDTWKEILLDYDDAFITNVESYKNK